jgi:hypothetical protein
LKFNDTLLLADGQTARVLAVSRMILGIMVDGKSHQVDQVSVVWQTSDGRRGGATTGPHDPYPIAQ